MSKQLETKDVLAAMYRGEIDPEKATTILAARMSPVDLAEALVDAFNRGGIRPLFCDEDGLPHGRDQVLPVVDPPINNHQRAALRAAAHVAGDASDLPRTDSEFRLALMAKARRNHALISQLDELDAEDDEGPPDRPS